MYKFKTFNQSEWASKKLHFNVQENGRNKITLYLQDFHKSLLFVEK